VNGPNEVSTGKIVLWQNFGGRQPSNPLTTCAGGPPLEGPKIFPKQVAANVINVA